MSFRELSMIAKLSWRNVFRNKRRTAISVATVAVGIWSAISLSAIARGMSKGLADNAIRSFTGHIQIHAKGYLDDPSLEHSMPKPNSRLLSLLQSPEVSVWAPRIRVPAVIMSERESFGVTLLGIDPEREASLSIIGDSLGRGRKLGGPKDPGIIVGERLLELLQSDLGKRIVIMTQGKDGGVADRGFRVVGTFDAELESTEKSFVLTSLGTARELTGLEHSISEISLLLKDPSLLDTLVKKLRGAAPALSVESWKSLEPLAQSMVKLQSGFLWLFFLVIVISISFGLVNSIFMAMLERSREIGIIRAIGMNARSVILLIACESAVLVIIGALVGNALAFGTLFLIRDGLDMSSLAKGAEFVGFTRIVYPLLKFSDFSFSNGLIILLGIMGSLYPAWRITRISPVDAIANRQG